MSRLRAILTILLLSLTAPAAAQNRGSQAGLLQADEGLAAIVVTRGLRAGLDSLLTDNGVLLLPGAPVAEGRAEIARQLQAQPGLDTLAVQWHPIAADVSAAGDFGATWGITTVHPAQQPRAAALFGKYIAVWEWREGWRLCGLLLVGGLQGSIGAAPRVASRLAPAAPDGGWGHFIRADRDFAEQAAQGGAPAAFQRYAAPDATMFSGGILLRGPEQIERSLSGGDPADWQWHPVLAGGAASGDLGFTVGEAVIRPRAGGRPFYSKYLTVWRRFPDGSVRFITDGGNARPAE